MKYFHKFNKLLKETFVYYYVKKNYKDKDYVEVAYADILRYLPALLSCILILLYIPFIIIFSGNEKMALFMDEYHMYVLIASILFLYIYAYKFLKKEDTKAMMEKSFNDEEYRNYIKSRASIYLAISVLPALISICFFVIYYREELFKQQ